MRPEAAALSGPASVSGRAGPTAFHMTGEGEALVLVHGVGMAREVWQPQADDLARDHCVVTYDLLGHGGSDLPPAKASLADYGAQLLALLDHLGIESAHVVGHSMGALVALQFALDHPKRVRSVAPLNGVFRRTPLQREAIQARAAVLEREGVAATLPSTLERWFGDPPPPHLQAAADTARRLLLGVNLAGYARTYRVFAGADEAHASRLADLQPPALFMTAQFDPNSSPEMSRAMADCVPGAWLRVLPGARHMMTLTHPAEVNAALREFLAHTRR